MWGRNNMLHKNWMKIDTITYYMVVDQIGFNSLTIGHHGK